MVLLDMTFFREPEIMKAPAGKIEIEWSMVRINGGYCAGEAELDQLCSVCLSY